MIDIFFQGWQHHSPYSIDLSEMFRGCGAEFLQFCLTLVLMGGLYLLFQRKQKALWAALALALGQCLYVWCVSIRSEFFFSFLFAGILTAQAGMLGLIPLSKASLLLLFSCLLFPARLFNNTTALLGHLWLFWVIFAGCYLVCWVQQTSLHGLHFPAYFTGVVLCLSAYGIYVAVSFLDPWLTRQMGSHALGLSCTMAILTPVLLAGTGLLRWTLGSQISRIRQFSEKHERLEGYFSWLTLLVLGICTMIFLPFTILSSLNTLVLLFFPSLCLALLLLQMVFVLLLYRVAFYKDCASVSSWEREGLRAYYRDLGENLATMQEIRHDIKNIFFTMGGFVDRSDDEEMKAFFWGKIYPHGESAIRQSELLSAIYQLPNESLRAFFYMKVSQMVQRKVPVTIRMNLLPEHFHLGMDIVDLTRVLGVLLDNAWEEAQQVPQGKVEIQISGNENGCSYLVRNSVTNRTRASGVRPGISTKGQGHGNGLLIAEKILEQYRNAILNSCMQQQTFTQCLTISTGVQ